MNIGGLYQIKKWFWLLYPTKDIAVAAAPADAVDAYAAAYAASIAAACVPLRPLACATPSPAAWLVVSATNCAVVSART